MTTPQTPATAPPVQRFRVLVGSLMGALFIFLLVLGLALGFEGYPPVAVAAGLGALAVVVHLTVGLVGYQAVPVLPEATPRVAVDSSVAAFQSGTVLRFALCESVAIIALVASFVVDPHTAMTYLVGMTLSLVLMAWHVWPSERLVARVERSLDRAGGRSRLTETLFARPSGGALLS